MSDDAIPPEPWKWPEAHWRSLIARGRAGRRLKPDSWKDGARCAVAFSFDSDHETNELYAGAKSISRISWGDYGSRVGVPRLLEVLGRHGVPATFYVPAVSALIHPEEQRRVAAAGHEIGLHGWIHEIPSVLPAAAERDLMLRSSDTLEKITGVRPEGIRTPGWDFSPATIDLCREMGLIYDSSLMADEDCYEIVDRGQPTGIVEVPVEWSRDDAMYLVNNQAKGLHPYLSPADVFDIFRREFDGAYADGGVFQMTMHPHVIAYRSRIWILEELIRHARAHPGVWFATHRDVAVWARDHSPKAG